MSDNEITPGTDPKCNPFGTRYLVDESRVWDHNAWDNVEWSEEQLKKAEGVIEQQKKVKVNEERAQELLDQPVKQWDAFYSQHTNNFFKDRNWLLKEFHELDMDYYNGVSFLSFIFFYCQLCQYSYLGNSCSCTGSWLRRWQYNISFNPVGPAQKNVPLHFGLFTSCRRSFEK